MTEIQGTLENARLGFSRSAVKPDSDTVFVYMPHLWNAKTQKVEGTGIDIGVKKSDLKDALRKEFGWIVIEENPLVMKVEDYDAESVLVGGEIFSKSIDPEMARAQAQRWIAIAEYVEAKPKIDPADLETAKDALMVASENWMTHARAEKIARALLASGKVEVKKDA